MSDTVLYGISNCDTVRKARRFLDDNGIDYRFHDFRKDGMDSVPLKSWLDQLGGDALVNRRGTTWRKLDAAGRESFDATPDRLLIDYPTLIRRPVLTRGKHLMVGFSADQYRQLID